MLTVDYVIFERPPLREGFFESSVSSLSAMIFSSSTNFNFFDFVRKSLS